MVETRNTVGRRASIITVPGARQVGSGRKPEGPPTETTLATIAAREVYRPPLGWRLFALVPPVGGLAFPVSMVWALSARGQPRGAAMLIVIVVGSILTVGIGLRAA